MLGPAVPPGEFDPESLLSEDGLSDEVPSALQIVGLLVLSFLVPFKTPALIFQNWICRGWFLVFLRS